MSTSMKQVEVTPHLQYAGLKWRRSAYNHPLYWLCAFVRALACPAGRYVPRAVLMDLVSSHHLAIYLPALMLSATDTCPAAHTNEPEGAHEACGR